jgi:hypothetical protein
VDTVALYHLMALAANQNAPMQVRGIAWSRLDELAKASSVQPESHRRHAARLIERFRQDPKQIPLPAPLEAPPGQPI